MNEEVKTIHSSLLGYLIFSGQHRRTQYRSEESSAVWFPLFIHLLLPFSSSLPPSKLSEADRMEGGREEERFNQ